MNNRRFAPVCIVLMFIASLFALPSLSDEVPIHWNASGQVDGYGSRWVAALLLPILSAVIFGLLRFLPKHDPIPTSDANRGIIEHFANWIVLFLLIVHVVTLANALGLQVDVIRLIMIAAGVLLVVIGNEMGRLKPNSWAGVRLPWTMTDEDVWRESNRMGGRALVVVGLLVIVSAALLPTQVMFFTTLGVILIGAFFMIGYSYRVAMRKRSGTD